MKQKDPRPSLVFLPQLQVITVPQLVWIERAVVSREEKSCHRYMPVRSVSNQWVVSSTSGQAGFYYLIFFLRFNMMNKFI
jgi:hypothetical protein